MNCVYTQIERGVKWLTVVKQQQQGSARECHHTIHDRLFNKNYSLIYSDLRNVTHSARRRAPRKAFDARSPFWLDYFTCKFSLAVQSKGWTIWRMLPLMSFHSYKDIWAEERGGAETALVNFRLIMNINYENIWIKLNERGY